MALMDEIWSGTKKKLKEGRDLLDSVSKADPKVFELVNERLREQDKWNDVFSTKLIELLDKSDSIKAEIRQKLKAMEEASRAQAELVCAADEHRRLASEYQKSSRMLADASQKYVQAAEIQVEASELKSAVERESAAREQLLLAFGEAQVLQTSLANFGKEYERLNVVEQNLITRASGLITGAERLEVDAKREHAEALQILESARQRETEAGEKFNKARHAHTEAAERLAEAKELFAESASTQSRSEAKRREAEGFLQTAARDLREGASKLSQAEAANASAREVHKSATQALIAAEGKHSTAKEILEHALCKADEAELKHREAALSQEFASSQLRTARTLVTACIASSGVIAVWGVYFGVHSGWPYSWLPPTALTILAAAFSLYAMRKAL